MTRDVVGGSSEGLLTVTVADDGPGIPPEVGDRVFERLYTGREGPQRAIGTGLGLAIVRELAQSMGGDVGVRSEPGAGAAFTIRLPVPPNGKR